MDLSVWSVNGLLIVGTCGLALWLWGQGVMTVGAIALAVALVIRINNMAGWIMWVVTGIFENIGTVQEGMETIAEPHSIVDAEGATKLAVPSGEIRYDGIRFHYGKDLRCHRRSFADNRAWRTSRSRRPLRRWKIHPGQLAVPFLRSWKADAS